jgi:hypothetical protein
VKDDKTDNVVAMRDYPPMPIATTWVERAGVWGAQQIAGLLERAIKAERQNIADAQTITELRAQAESSRTANSLLAAAHTRTCELLDLATALLDEQNAKRFTEALRNASKRTPEIARANVQLAAMAQDSYTRRASSDLMMIRVAHESFCAIDYGVDATELPPKRLVAVLANIAGAFAAHVVNAITDGHEKAKNVLFSDPRVMLLKAADRFDVGDAAPRQCPHCYEALDSRAHECPAGERYNQPAKGAT